MTVTPEQARENRQVWADALLSGEFTQGKHALHVHADNGGPKHDEFCCLGVACVVALKSGVELKVDDEPDEYPDVSYDGQTAYLPEPVREWLGLASVGGNMDDGNSLTQLNDLGADFERIAGIIREEPEGLVAV